MSNKAALRRVDPDILDTIHALFPGAELRLGASPGGRASFRLVPGIRRTHLLVPADAPVAAGKAVDRRSAKDTPRQLLIRRAVRTALRTPVVARTLMPHVLHVGPSADSLLDYLEAAVGTELRVSMAIGSRRANRKPVLSVHSAAGEEIGYAKVGLTPLADALIEHEANTLSSLSAAPSPRHFKAPTVIHHGTWGSAQVLLMQSLRPRGHRSPQGVPLTAMAELASRQGVTWTVLEESAWVAAIRSDSVQCSAAGEAGFAEAVRQYERAFGSVRMPFGGWHGDLGPWNMVWEGDTPSIWDWERAQGDVPLGIDAVHFTCHSALRDIGNLDRARETLEGKGTEALASLHAELSLTDSDPRLRQAVLLGYLLSMAARFSIDAGRPDGLVVRDLARWHVTVLMDQLARRSSSWS